MRRRARDWISTAAPARPARLVSSGRSAASCSHRRRAPCRRREEQLAAQARPSLFPFPLVLRPLQQSPFSSSSRLRLRLRIDRWRRRLEDARCLSAPACPPPCCPLSSLESSHGTGGGKEEHGDELLVCPAPLYSGAGEARPSAPVVVRKSTGMR